MKNQLGTAIALASKIHQNQKDKGGNAYILHPIRIMLRLRTDDEELMCIAILHDVVEDSNGEVTIEGLRSLGFSSRILNALTLLTHDPNEPYMDYIKRIATNPDAVRVKLEDLRDNSDISRLKDLSDKHFDRLKLYNQAYTFLKKYKK